VRTRRRDDPGTDHRGGRWLLAADLTPASSAQTSLGRRIVGGLDVNLEALAAQHLHGEPARAQRIEVGAPRDQRDVLARSRQYAAEQAAQAAAAHDREAHRRSYCHVMHQVTVDSPSLSSRARSAGQGKLREVRAEWRDLGRLNFERDPSTSFESSRSSP
jgi:hypothetical protein